MCICSKILEHVIYSCIFEHLDCHQILTEQQHGFRQNRNCVTQLISTIHDFAQCLNDNGQCDVLLLDFCKAFDKVPYYTLNSFTSYIIMESEALSGLVWIKNFLSNRSQRVILDNKQSSPTDFLSGVPQGTVLVPLLFLIFINDIPLNVQSKIRLYADDVILYCDIRSAEDCYVLQNDLDLLAQWSHKWQMMFIILRNAGRWIFKNFKPLKLMHFYTVIYIIVQSILSWTATRPW